MALRVVINVKKNFPFMLASTRRFFLFLAALFIFIQHKQADLSQFRGIILFTSSTRYCSNNIAKAVINEHNRRINNFCMSCIWSCSSGLVSNWMECNLLAYNDNMTNRMRNTVQWQRCSLTAGSKKQFYASLSRHDAQHWSLHKEDFYYKQLI